MSSLTPAALALLLVALASCAADQTVPSGVPAKAPATPPTASAPVAAAPLDHFPYPTTRREDVTELLHGVTVHDPYRWLEDGASPEVQAWMHDEDARARAALAKIPLRDALAARAGQLFHREQQGWGPARYGKRLFYERRPKDRERMLVYVQEGDEPAKVLLDSDGWSPDKSLSLGGWWVTRDGQRVLYQVRRNNSDAAVLRVMDVSTGKIADETIPGAEWPDPAWDPSGDGFYYQWLPDDPALHADRWSHGEGRFHKLGDDPRRDAVVRPPTPGQLGTTLSMGDDGRWLFAAVHRAWGKSDLYFEDVRARRPTWRTLAEGGDGSTWGEARRDEFFLHSTVGAPNGQIFRVDPGHPERERWRLVVPERDVPILSWDLVNGRLVVQVMKDVLTRVEIHDLDGKLVRELPSHGVGSTTLPWAPPGSDEAYYKFESYDRAPEVWRASIATGAESLWYREEVPADLSRLVVDEEFYPSKDGTRIPMFVVRPKDAPRDGSAPALLYGYGAADNVTRPYFRASVIPWIERGGVYAVAHVRGGGEYGEAWHKAGNLRNKQRTFDDFIAAAEHLVKDGLASPARLAIYGGSWGGLLVTAALTQRPDLFRAVIAEVPQTDMIRFPLTGLGRSPIAEFGDPANPEDFRALLAYSPYHHVAPGTHYPAVLVTASETDERVDALHARKFVAAMQAASTGGPVALRVEWGAGHMGSGKASDDAEKKGDEFAFALDAMGQGGR
jgi:prolyl oligopeptidase